MANRGTRSGYSEPPVATPIPAPLFLEVSVGTAVASLVDGKTALTMRLREIWRDIARLGGRRHFRAVDSGGKKVVRDVVQEVSRNPPETLLFQEKSAEWKKSSESPSLSNLH
jgi:hypothetical protein